MAGLTSPADSDYPYVVWPGGGQRRADDTATEEDTTRPDYGLFAVDGAVRGNRPDNGQARRTYCDGIRSFAQAKGYPTGAAPC